ncbi:hypothetical protein DFH08DRAFT_797193 [Mycena albidolilacea]|uniref:Uncharacterized protein n=1 Tax=Mycena albidolilacea TaxID=1033008 RepID=A0AAD7ARJ6_9AGAR|nr:hypothetical protein DFH08DRAFT_797193 [Mycena albidolilacea]
MPLGLKLSILWAFASAWLTIYIATQQHPSHKLGRVERKIKACKEILKHEKANYPRNLGKWMDRTRRLLEARLAASKIQSRLLETLRVSTSEELVKYLRDMKETMQNVNQSAKDAKEIRRTTLTIQLKNFQLTIEAECQCEFFEGIKELHDIHDTAISATARRAQTVTHCFESTVTSV